MISRICNTRKCWVDIPNYEGWYQVSSDGDVRSLKKWCVDKREYANHIKLLKPMDNGKGYLYVFLTKDHVRKRFYVHRLVAKVFMKQFDENKVINHKDYNKKNNNINNLELITQKENVNYSSDNMKKCHKVKENKLGIKYIRKRFNKYELTLKRKYIGSYLTLEEAICVRDKLIGGDEYYGDFKNMQH